MTAATASQLLAEVQRLGGRLVPKPPDGLTVRLPAPPSPELLASLRQAKPEILRLLTAEPPYEPCPAGHPAYWWRLAEGDPWRCGRCEPDPRAARWAGVTLAVLGDREIVLHAPTRDLPTPCEWVQTPAGAANLICYTPDGGEGLCRLFQPRPGQSPFVWVPAGKIIGEADWCGCRRPA